MRKSIALLLVLVFLTASCVISAKPALSSADVTEDSWASKAPVPSSVWGVAAANGKIYAFARNVTYEYNPITNVWTTKNPLPSNMYGSALAVYQNKIYVIEDNGMTQVYDPATDTWETKASMPTPRTQLEANVVNGKIYVIGGRTGGQYSTVGLNEVYDPATDSWTTKAPIPYPVVEYASAVVDNKIYVIGGQDEFHDPMNLDLTQIYDPESDTWSFGSAIPNVVWKAAAGATTGLMAPKRIYVIGGMPATLSLAFGGRLYGSLDGTPINQVYNPENDSWTVGASMPTARFQLKVAVVNDMIYAIGGSPYFNLQGIWCPENEQYTPIGYGTVPPAVAVVSPESKTYNASSVSLVFTVNKPVVWMGYSLDGQETVTITGNITITGLTSGLRNVTVYAKDEFENIGTSETIVFTVTVPFPTTWVVAAIAIAITGGSALAIYYFKKPKRKGNNSQRNQTKP